jgi:hypothetical protein
MLDCKPYNVYDNNILIDKVYFIEGMTEEEVKKSLVEHDNYPANIIVKERKYQL